MSHTGITQERAKIRRYNDQLRCHGIGNGSLFMTQGIMEKGKGYAAQALSAVRDFDQFTKDNDPHGEHDFGSLEMDGQRLFWKIDYYAPDLQRGSENPADDTQTHRVLTIMLAHEY